MVQTSRRRFLQGAAGASLALPWLESLAGAAAKPAKRLAIFYVPIGVVRRGFFPGEQDARLPKFSSDQIPIEVNAGIRSGLHPFSKLTPTQEPLESVKDKVTFVTGLERFYKNGSDVHAQCGSCFLSSATIDSVTSTIYPLDRTLDHVVADHVGAGTPFPTLELSCNSHKDNKEDFYFDNISWYGPNHVAPSLRDPRKVFRRLFGNQDIKLQRNLTDLVLEDARSLQRKLSLADRDKFVEYFDSIRALEQQMTKREQLQVDLSQTSLKEPPDAYLPRGEYIRLMGDLMIAALQTGLTRVATLMVGPERWDTPYMFETLFDKPMSHHQMSHDQAKYVNELLRVDRFHLQQFAYLVQKMDRVTEADGTSLLHNTLFTYGSGLGDGATHQYSSLPILVAGGGGGHWRAGQHLHFADPAPLANLWLTQAQIMGLPVDRFADSTGPITSLLT